MSDRISSLPPEEKCCATTLACDGFTSLMQSFVFHCLQHGIETPRRAEIWTQELLVQAALGLITAAHENGRSDLATLDEFKQAAVVAWREAMARRAEAQMIGRH